MRVGSAARIAPAKWTLYSFTPVEEFTRLLSATVIGTESTSEKDALEKLQYDLYYVKNRSLLFDLAILVQTVEVVLWGKGAR